jgi:inner membrane protein
MSSTVAHFLAGAALVTPALRLKNSVGILPSWTIPITSGLLAMAPDLDLAGRRLFGITSGSVFAHRGFFHSPFFLVIFAAVLAGLVAHSQPRPTFVRLWIIWAAAMLTHPLLDALSDGGRGVMLLLPLSRVRLFLPWRPIFNPAGHGASLFTKAFYLRASEIPFLLAFAAIGYACAVYLPLFRNAPRRSV